MMQIYVDPNFFIKEIEGHSEGTIEENKKSLQDIINILVEIMQAIADSKINVPYWKKYLETLVHKLIYTSNSIIKLIEGYELKTFNNSVLIRKVVDYPTLYILSRALIENYVTLSYIYNNVLKDEERIFRFKLWEVSGLISRQNFENELENTDIKQKKLDEEEMIEKIISEISKMSEYKNLDKGQLKKLENHGLPRIESWNKLIQQSNLKQPNFSNLYSLFSNYAHSEYLGIMQTSQSSHHADDQRNIESVKLVLNHVRIIISLTIKYCTNNFISAEIIFNTFPQIYQTSINLYAKIGSK